MTIQRPNIQRPNSDLQPSILPELPAWRFAQHPSRDPVPSDMRKEWIDNLQKTLLRMTHLRGELYEAITDDNETYDRICDDLRIMIERLEAADDEKFLRAEEAVNDAERRRLEAFGI